MLGPERPIVMSRQDRERIAYHEGGHAILGLVVPGADPVHRVTIVARGQALGVTYQCPDSDRTGMVQLAPPENRFLVGGAAGFDGFGGGGKPFSEATAQAIDAEVQRIINECHEDANRLLNEHRRALDALAAALMERETLGEREILEVTGLPPAPSLGTGKAAAADGPHLAPAHAAGR